MIDARRMEVYSAIYDLSLNPVKPVSADIIEADTYENFLREQSVFYIFWQRSCEVPFGIDKSESPFFR